MTKSVKSIAGVAILLLVGGCDPIHAPIYNLTSCPIEVVTSITKFPHSLGSPVRILPGHTSGVLGGTEPVKYDELIVRDSHNTERHYDENVLGTLRPNGITEDQWGFSDGGLSFLKEEPSAASLNQIAEQACSSNAPNGRETGN